MPPRELPHLGPRLKAVREAVGLSQQEVAMRAKVSVSIISHIEQGRKTDPRLSTIVALAEALGVTVGQLADELMRTGESAPKKPKGKRPK